MEASFVSPPRILSIGGSDPSCGAGVQADLYALRSLGMAASTVITCITAQNSQGVLSSYPLPVELVEEQLQAVWADGVPAAVKIGLIGSAEVARAVAGWLRERTAREQSIPLIIDPVLAASDGTSFLDGDAIGVLRDELLPLAFLATPNLAEARTLAEGPTGSRSPGESDGFDGAEQIGLAHAIRALGPSWVLVTGGDRLSATDKWFDADVSDRATDESSGQATDWLVDKERQWSFSAALRPFEVRGTGCLLASAIAAHLAGGMNVPQAVEASKNWVTEVIDRSVPLGGGRRQAVPFQGQA